MCSFNPAFLTSAIPQLLFPTHQSRRPRRHFLCCQQSKQTSNTRARDKLFQILSTRSTNDRTTDEKTLLPLIEKLESETYLNPPSASSSLLIGSWRDAFATRPNTASPIQRLAVSAASFAPKVEQLVISNSNSNTPSAIVNRVDLRPILGAILNVVAKVESISESRLYIRFTKAWFRVQCLPNWLGGINIGNGFTVPYPVPFRLLGDKATGWIDVSYLDPQLRIVRGNKGTCFVLVKVPEGDELVVTKDILELDC